MKRIEKKISIPVTKTFLPPLEEYSAYLQRIWDTNQLTNNGPLVQELESQLKEFLGADQLFFVNNGTTGLQISIKALRLKGEIITTPFSYVATTSSIVWEGCTPVFVDVDPTTFCIDADLIEKRITSQTSAILATHVYGIPCDVAEISRIAKKYALRVIYDSAHAFGVTYQDQSIAAYGDVSVFSFHATKLFHTTEGGAIVSNHPDFHKELEYMRRFGHNGPEDFWGVGINGKNSEFHAAMGLCMLPRTREIIERYKQLNEEYHHYLEGICLSYPQIPEGTKYNYAYFPVVFPDETQLLKTRAALQEENIHPRRYFYPSLNTLSYVKLQTTPISEDISHRVLCLPLFFDLTYQDVQHICDVILKSLKPS